MNEIFNNSSRINCLKVTASFLEVWSKNSIWSETSYKISQFDLLALAPHSQNLTRNHLAFILCFFIEQIQLLRDRDRFESFSSFVLRENTCQSWLTPVNKRSENTKFETFNWLNRVMGVKRSFLAPFWHSKIANSCSKLLIFLKLMKRRFIEFWFLPRF